MTAFNSTSSGSRPEAPLDQLLLESVQDTLRGIFGQKVPDAVYERLESNYSIPRSEIPSRVSEFALGLEGLFGVASEPIERAIAKRLYSKLGVKYRETRGIGLVEYLDEAKRAQGLKS